MIYIQRERYIETPPKAAALQLDDVFASVAGPCEKDVEVEPPQNC